MDGKGFGDAMLFLSIVAAFGLVFTLFVIIGLIVFAFTGDTKQLIWALCAGGALGALTGFRVWRSR